MTEFNREVRYVAIKLKDLNVYQADALKAFFELNDIPTREGVVIESHWSVYDDAWKLVEQEWEQDNE